MLAHAGPLENDLRAVDWAPNNKFVIAGDMNGKIHLFSADSLKPLN